MKIRGSLTWYHHVFEVSHKGHYKKWEDKKKHRLERGRVCLAAETAEQKEHTLSKPRTIIEQGMLLVQLLRQCHVVTPRRMGCVHAGLLLKGEAKFTAIHVAVTSSY